MAEKPPMCKQCGNFPPEFEWDDLCWTCNRCRHTHIEDGHCVWCGKSIPDDEDE